MYREHDNKIKPRLFKARFIPVCTGNIGNDDDDEIDITVYPCVYREHELWAIANKLKAGLSLCVQGT